MWQYSPGADIKQTRKSDFAGHNNKTDIGRPAIYFHNFNCSREITAKMISCLYPGTKLQ